MKKILWHNDIFRKNAIRCFWVSSRVQYKNIKKEGV